MKILHISTSKRQVPFQVKGFSRPNLLLSEDHEFKIDSSTWTKKKTNYQNIIIIWNGATESLHYMVEDINYDLYF